jgi:hypothetical protein
MGLVFTARSKILEQLLSKTTVTFTLNIYKNICMLSFLLFINYENFGKFVFIHRGVSCILRNQIKIIAFNSYIRFRLLLSLENYLANLIEPIYQLIHLYLSLQAENTKTKINLMQIIK